LARQFPRTISGKSNEASVEGSDTIFRVHRSGINGRRVHGAKWVVGCVWSLQRRTVAIDRGSCFWITDLFNDADGIRFHCERI